MQINKWSIVTRVLTCCAIAIVCGRELPVTEANAQEKQGTPPGYTFEIKTDFGVVSPILYTPYGSYKINIPNDVQPGETFTGSVWLEPAGNNDEQREKNLRELRKDSLEIEGKPIHVPDDLRAATLGHFEAQWNDPDYNMRVQAHLFPKIWDPRVDKYMEKVFSEKDYTVPTGAQQGSLIRITGPLDGIKSDSDFVEIGGKGIPLVTESHHSRVVWNTSETVGSSSIKVGENGRTFECPFHNISVNLSAGNLKLLKGQTTVLTVVVKGLEDLGQDVPFDLVNHSPAIVGMQGGNEQGAIIHAGDASHPSDLKADGSYTTTRTLTGVAAGGFNITATVHWRDTCRHSLWVVQRPKSESRTNALAGR